MKKKKSNGVLFLPHRQSFSSANDSWLYTLFFSLVQRDAVRVLQVRCRLVVLQHCMVFWDDTKKWIGDDSILVADANNNVS